MQDQAGRVRRYYNKNTLWMLFFGQGRGEALIHRPVWFGEIKTRKQALHTVHRLIAGALFSNNPIKQATDRGNSTVKLHILDLGCGAGGSALWLAENYLLRVTGITLSPVQVRAAQRLAGRRDLTDRCRFLVGDFTELPPLADIDAAYAIESFSHGGDPTSFFHQVSRLIPSGGKLILCDDFLTPRERAPSTAKRERWVSRFRYGWHLQSLMQAEQTLRLASKHGFELIQNINLTPYLRPTASLLALGQRLLGAALRKTAWGASVYGGSALQVCQKNGWTEYLFLVLEKR
jgi:ubiquinone/menaquinone biosynthesis C-methylase UbiE